ncbi:MAG TPA: hypothetical protein ENJ18_19030, partial [Nannocystis exedens]|nr:hypothetical protein [Nannocystis exedens]
MSRHIRVVKRGDDNLDKGRTASLTGPRKGLLQHAIDAKEIGTVGPTGPETAGTHAITDAVTEQASLHRSALWKKLALADHHQ